MTCETQIDPRLSLGALVAERPARAQLFEELRLKYCCGGHQTLAEACANRGLDVNAVRDALEALDPESPEKESTDWRGVGIGEFCSHIVAVHHEGLRERFSRIESLLRTVVEAHSAHEPRLARLQKLFGELRAELEPHLADEESELFPAYMAWEQARKPIPADMLLEHERAHASLGDALVALRALCHDYDRDAALSDAHRALLDALETFEYDLHRHVHEENNILLPRIRRGPADREPRSEARRAVASSIASAGRSREPLPHCCEAWIAAQTHNLIAQRRRSAPTARPGRS
jgi:regulator of cell morphogenesis and NO signaling